MMENQQTFQQNPRSKLYLLSEMGAITGGSRGRIPLSVGWPHEKNDELGEG
jgi:hypothetical protein